MSSISTLYEFSCPHAYTYLFRITVVVCITMPDWQRPIIRHLLNANHHVVWAIALSMWWDFIYSVLHVLTASAFYSQCHMISLYIVSVVFLYKLQLLGEIENGNAISYNRLKKPTVRLNLMFSCEGLLFSYNRVFRKWIFILPFGQSHLHRQRHTHIN